MICFRLRFSSKRNLKEETTDGQSNRSSSYPDGVVFCTNHIASSHHFLPLYCNGSLHDLLQNPSYDPDSKLFCFHQLLYTDGYSLLRTGGGNHGLRRNFRSAFENSGRLRGAYPGRFGPCECTGLHAVRIHVRLCCGRCFLSGLH